MNAQEFKEYYKKNKVVVVGVPFIFLILFADLLVLRPAREAKRREKLGITTEDTRAVESAAPAALPKDEVAYKPPPLIARPVFNSIDPRLDTRVSRNNVYPYGKSRNIFGHYAPKRIEEVFLVENQEAPQSHLDVTYHGFFKIGDDQIAILRSGGKLMHIAQGRSLASPGLVLFSIQHDRVLLFDPREPDRLYEVGLSGNTAKK